jgi:hypothetical protein
MVLQVSLDVRERLKDQPDGHYVVVTGINPTPLGEVRTLSQHPHIDPPEGAHTQRVRAHLARSCVEITVIVRSRRRRASVSKYTSFLCLPA